MALDLCTVKRAEKPYYIENISTPIWTIEELCYYLYDNVYLVDESICNEILCDWLRDELDLKRLYRILYGILDKQEGAAQFVSAIFREIGYLDNASMRSYHETIRRLEVQPEDERQKLKGDYLVRCGMYANAVFEYRQILSRQHSGNLGAAFYAAVWNNLGSAYARMFQFESAGECFLTAWKKGRSKEAMRKYISTLPLFMTEEAYREKLSQLGADEELIRVIREYNDRVSREASQQLKDLEKKDPRMILRELTDEYCRRAKVMG